MARTSRQSVTHETESNLLHHGACAICGSKDNRAFYDDGHSYCFSCPEEDAYQAGDGTPSTPAAPKQKAGLLHGEIEPLTKRKIDRKTAEKFGYRIGMHRGRPVHIAPYMDTAGRIVAQKWRDADKHMEWVGTEKDALPLFGQAIWQDAGRQIVVTEGEIDAMSYAQSTGLKWPAVSLPNGARSASKSIAAAADWLERFERVVLMFDMDEPGRAAAEEAAAILTPGKVFIAKLPLKDANEMVQAGRSDELVRAAWDAQSYRPDGIIRVSDAIEVALAAQGYGFAWPWRGPSEATYGIRRGELYGWGAGVGAGKTTAFKQVILSAIKPSIIEDHGDLPVKGLVEPRKVGTLLLEENARRKTLLTLGGMAIGKRVHVPGVEFDPAELRAAMEAMDPYLFMYDHFGAKDWSGIKDIIRHMVLGEGIEDVFLDNLTALLAFAEDDRKELDGIMADLASMVEQHNFTLHYISHLTTPDGKAHEEGGRVLAKQFTGGRAIARWSHNMVALERDQQTPDGITTLRILKDRETGDAAGRLFGLDYVRDTGLFREVSPPGEGGFRDETKANDF